MQDLIFVLVIVALTVISALFVLACDKIVGPDATALAENDAASRSVREEEKVNVA